MNVHTRGTFIRAGLIAGMAAFAGATPIQTANEKKEDEEKK